MDISVRGFQLPEMVERRDFQRSLIDSQVGCCGVAHESVSLDVCATLHDALFLSIIGRPLQKITITTHSKRMEWESCWKTPSHVGLCPRPQAYVVFERPTTEQVQVLSRTFVTWIVTVNAGENELFLSSSQIDMVHLACFSFNPGSLVDFKCFFMEHLTNANIRSGNAANFVIVVVHDFLRIRSPP